MDIHSTLQQSSISEVAHRPSREMHEVSLVETFGLETGIKMQHGQPVLDPATSKPVKKDKLIKAFTSPGALTPKLNKNYVFPKEETVQFLMALEARDTTYLLGHSGSGKAQPLDSLVLTPEGWIQMGDVRVGTTLCTPNGKTATVVGVFPQGEKDVYRLSFSDKTNAESCLEHLWRTQTAYERSVGKSSVKNLAEIKETLTYCGKRNHFVENTAYSPVKALDSVEFSRTAECMCILLDDEEHMYITNDYIPTHNTELVNQVAARLNYNVIQVNFDGHLSRSDLIGDWKITSGEMKFRYGLIPLGFTEPGSIVLLDEVDACPPETAFVMQRAVSQDRRFLMHETNQMFELHPQNCIVGTANTNGMGDDSSLYIAGTNVQNFSFLNRWQTVIQIDYISRTAEEQVLRNMFTAKHAQPHIPNVCRVLESVREAFKNGTISTPLTTRDGINWMEKITRLPLPMKAARYSFLDKLPQNDAMAIAQLIGRHFKLVDKDDKKYLSVRGK